MAMTNPSITELLKRAECRYTLVVKVSKRARSLVAGVPPLTNTKETKALAIAIDEINRGLIEHNLPSEVDQ